MEEAQGGIKLAQALDRLKACADGYQTRVCLTSKECLEVCAYIFWLTDMIVRKEALDGRADRQR